MLAERHVRRPGREPRRQGDAVELRAQRLQEGGILELWRPQQELPRRIVEPLQDAG
jgi:hypothetical protein